MRTNSLIVSLILVCIFISNIELYSQRTIRIGCKLDPTNVEVNKKVQLRQLSYTEGFDHDLMLKLKEHLEQQGYGVEFVTIALAERIPKLRQNKVDLVIASFTISEARKQKIGFSNQYVTNDGLGILVKRPSKLIRSRDILDGAFTITASTGTTSDSAIIKLKKQNDNLKLIHTTSRAEAIQRLKHGESDAHVDDVNNLMHYSYLDPNLQLLGNLPTADGNMTDSYGIAFHKDSLMLGANINEFLTKNQQFLKELKSKWFGISNQRTLDAINNQEPVPSQVERFLTEYGILILVFVLLIAIIFSFLIIRTSRNTQQSLEKAISSLKEELQLRVLSKEEIVLNGIDFFRTAKKSVYYIGAGGFMAETGGTDWRNAINFAMRSKKLIRIVDMPRLPQANAFFKDRKKIVDYCIWLLMQKRLLSNDQFRANFELWNSRGTSTWGHGLMLLIKDREEMLIFTGGAAKAGFLIKKEDIIGQFLIAIAQIKEKGNQIRSNSLTKDYFKDRAEFAEAYAILGDSTRQNSILEAEDVLEQLIDKLFPEHRSSQDDIGSGSSDQTNSIIT